MTMHTANLALDVRPDLPEGFLSVTARELHRLLPRPTLIELPGRRAQPLFVSILLHGNEDTGLRAVQQVLARHAGRELPRALMLFVGNVDAARAGLRHLDTQPDYNRVWPGTPLVERPEAALMAEVVARVAARKPWASIDVHNNTGLNPHYACVNRLEASTLQLATLFSRIVVYFTRPLGVQSLALSPLCPAITVECGKAGVTAGDAHAADLIEAALQMDHWPAHPPRPEDLSIYHTVATVKIPPDVDFGFDTPDRRLDLPADCERWNFSDLERGLRWGWVRGEGIPLAVHDEVGREVFDDWFEIAGDELRLRRAATPSMLTRDERVIRQDCLCYLMERLAPLGI